MVGIHGIAVKKLDFFYHTHEKHIMIEADDKIELLQKHTYLEKGYIIFAPLSGSFDTPCPWAWRCQSIPSPCCVAHCNTSGRSS